MKGVTLRLFILVFFFQIVQRFPTSVQVRLPLLDLRVSRSKGFYLDAAVWIVRHPVFRIVIPSPGKLVGAVGRTCVL